MVNLRNGAGAIGKNGSGNGTKRKRASLLALVNAVMMAGALRAPAADTATQPTPTPTPSTPATNSGSGAPKKKSGDGSTPAANTSGDASTLQEVVVTAKPEGAYQVTESANAKYTEPLRDTPQTITIIPQSLIKDQNASSLREALQNVPGITFAAGEGGTLAGDNFFIRGFNARNDIFVDGFRDSGNYQRDPFNLEQVEVVKGPASAYSGHGSTGGSINMISKEANLTPSYRASSGFGTDQYYRETIDINQPLSELGEAFGTTSFRLNAVYQSNNHSERDQIYDSHWGIDPTLTWGIGTDTKVSIDYFHLEQDNLPSYGLPVSNGNYGPSGHVAPVPYSNYYGFASRDFDRSVVDIPTLKVSHDFGEELQIENTSRYENTYHQQVVGPPRFGENAVIPPANNATVATLPGNVDRERRARRSIDTLYGNQTDFKGKFNTWTFQHDWVFTLEGSREAQDTRTNTGGNALPLNPPSQTSIFNPAPDDPYPFPLVWGPATKTQLDDYAFSLFDSIKLDPHWILSGGMRFDHAVSEQHGAGLPSLDHTDDLASWRAALTYKPIEPVSVYFGYGTSYNLSIEGVASDASSPDGLNAGTANLEPEKNTTYEFGTKWDALKEKLSLGAAFFRTIKNNTRVQDPTDPSGLTYELAGTSRVQGIELSAAGNITKDWKVFGGYSYMESEILSVAPGSSAATRATIGKKLPNVPEQSASIWTTYELPSLPYHFTVGTGAVFVDRRFAQTSNTTVADGYATQALMVECKPTKWLDFQLNVANLWDEHYIAATGSSSVAGDGRSVVFTTSVKF